MALINLPIPPMRDRFMGQKGDRNTDVNTGITFPWVRWFQQIIQVLNEFVAEITGNTLISVPQAGIASLGLGPANAGQQVWVTDYNHTLIWSGTAFGWGPGENGSGYVSAFLSAPSSSGWQLCDGSSTTRLNGDGTTSPVTVPDYTTATYLKLGTAVIVGPLASGGATAAVSAGTPAGAVVVGDNDASIEVQAGVGTTVAADPHQHPATFTGAALGAHQHGPGSVELRRTQLLAYYRR